MQQQTRPEGPRLLLLPYQAKGSVEYAKAGRVVPSHLLGIDAWDYTLPVE